MFQRGRRIACQGFLPGLGGLGRADHGVAVGFSLGDLCVAFDLGDARFTERFEVALPIADITDGEADDAQAHVGHVAGGDFLHLGGEGVAVLVDRDGEIQDCASPSFSSRGATKEVRRKDTQRAVIVTFPRYQAVTTALNQNRDDSTSPTIGDTK